MTHDKLTRLARGFAQEWLRPDAPEHATEALVKTLSTVMLAFHAVARGVEERAAAAPPRPPQHEKVEHDDAVEDRVRDLLDDADSAFSAGGVAVTMMVDAEIAQYLRSLLPALPVDVTRRCSFCGGTAFDRVQELFGGGWRTRCIGCQRTGTAV